MKNLVCALSLVVAAVPASAQQALSTPPPAQGDRPAESLVAARELYASAAYEDALAMLVRMRRDGPEIASTDGEVLKAFCLLALRRDAEARSVIEGVITERPMYLPSEEEASPRLREAFQDVRRKLLPTVARELYASARDDYDKKNAVAAAAKFGELLKVLSDPDLAKDPTLADLRLLAEGFREVSAAAANVATAADTRPLSSPPITAPLARGTASSSAGKPAGTGGTTAAGVARPEPSGAVPALQLPVSPPVAVNQQMPPWRGDPTAARLEFTGAIDLIIDEQGHVESVSLRKSVHPTYDPVLLEAAKAWTYQPARRGDNPIKFQKTIVVKLNSR
jgi:TonB family protein